MLWKLFYDFWMWEKLFETNIFDIFDTFLEIYNMQIIGKNLENMAVISCYYILLLMLIGQFPLNRCRSWNKQNLVLPNKIQDLTWKEFPQNELSRYRNQSLLEDAGTVFIAGVEVSFSSVEFDGTYSFSKVCTWVTGTTNSCIVYLCKNQIYQYSYKYNWLKL